MRILRVAIEASRRKNIKMASHTENTKRIAKNTLMLYVRMLFGMLVSLYTSRVILNTLGVEDFGINNVVGGVVGMLGFLTASMSGATSRFLTYELGRGDLVRLKETFSSALIIHIGIALVVFVIAETAGLWFFENKLVIPESRMTAAHVVYQLSILSTMLGITQVPYNATIIAHEKMNVYAYVEILNVCLRLLIVYLLVIGDFDKLILYSILTFSVSVLIMSIYWVYCIRHYEETKFHFIWKKDILKPMLSFSGWDLYGNASVTARTQGVSMLLNMFFGPLMNAAAGIATQVQNAVMAFAGNFIVAVRPQIVKQYAAGEYETMFKLLKEAIVLCFTLLSLLSVPLMSEAHFVLKIWLKIVPDYAVIFCNFTLLFNIFASISILLVSVVHATGKIFRPSFINGSLYLLVIPFTYVAFKLGCEPWVSFLFNVVAVVIGMTSNAWTIKLYVSGFPFKEILLKYFVRCVLILFSVYGMVYSLHFILDEGWERLMLSIFSSSILLSLGAFYILLTSSSRARLVSYLKKKLWKKA